jgi:hypothetical protein
MASFTDEKLKTKSLKRTARLHGLDAHVNIFMTETGVEMAVVGQKKRIFASWEHLAKAMHTDTNVPSFLHNRPWDFLKHQAKHQGKSNVQPIDSKTKTPSSPPNAEVKQPA